MKDKQRRACSPDDCTAFSLLVRSVTNFLDAEKLLRHKLEASTNERKKGEKNLIDCVWVWLILFSKGAVFSAKSAFAIKNFRH